MDGDLEVWQGILVRLYPVAKPMLSMKHVYDMLPLLHKYNIKGVMDECLEYLSYHFPASLSREPSSPCYIINWLKLADDLQLDDLRAVCMAKFRDMAHKKELGAAMIFPYHLRQRPARPDSCPVNHHSAACPAWCNKCGLWVCCDGVSGGTCKYKPSGESFVGGCGGITVPVTTAGCAWRRNDQALLRQSIKRLSRGVVDDLLASLVCVSNCNYKNE